MTDDEAMDILADRVGYTHEGYCARGRPPVQRDVRSNPCSCGLDESHFAVSRMRQLVIDAVSVFQQSHALGMLNAADVVDEIWDEQVKDRPMENVHRKKMDSCYRYAAKRIREAAERPDCETCSGLGTIDETIGGSPLAPADSPCPDCSSPSPETWTPYR